MIVQLSRLWAILSGRAELSTMKGSDACMLPYVIPCITLCKYNCFSPMLRSGWVAGLCSLILHGWGINWLVYSLRFAQRPSCGRANDSSCPFSFIWRSSMLGLCSPAARAGSWYVPCRRRYLGLSSCESWILSYAVVFASCLGWYPVIDYISFLCVICIM